MALQWYRNRWPWMILNDHFALKAVSGSASWRLRLSDKTVRKFAELPIYCQRQKCSPGNVVSGSIRFMQIFAGRRGSLESGRQMRVGSFKIAIFASFVHCLPNILHIHIQVIRLWAYFKVIGLFHIKFLKNGVWYDKSYCRLLVGQAGRRHGSLAR